MNRAITRISLALALGASLMAPMMSRALADGDPNYSNGINASGVRTPVPAPIPYPVEEADWYFRADFAAGFGAQPSVSSTGTPFGSGVSLGTIGLSDTWLGDSFLPSFTGGVGVGYVWSQSFRTDLTVDIHSIMSATFDGSQTYATGGVPGTLTVNDKTKFMSTILLANAYYDIRTGTPFTPYFGGGIGFAVNQLTRGVDWTDATGSFSESARTTRVNFAAAAMVGLNYEMSSFTSLDVGYRYLFIPGSDVNLDLNGIASDVAIGSINEHQIRAGLRFYVN
jgi:opacity protein-like surface antigen